MLTLDMGGTSADVGILVDGKQRHTTEYEIEWGVPAAVPTHRHQVDRRRRRVDRVGRRRRLPPRRAAKRGRGAGPDLLRPRRHRGDRHRREPPAGPARPRVLPRRAHAPRPRRCARGDGGARRTPRDGTPLDLAASIVEIANENMASAIKMVSLERGHDPRRFALLAFGGAGPLHAAAVARSSAFRA